MKKILPLLLLVFGQFAFSETGLPEVSQIDHLYIPNGFDDNDVVEVVLLGHFPDSCHQLSEAKVKIDEESKTVTITPFSYKIDDVSCVQMISPYVQVVNLGRMLKGNYSFNVTDNPQIQKNMMVKEAQVSERDDFMYPPVDFAEIENDEQGGTVLVVKGRYPLLKRGCMETRAARLELQGGDILVVQPKAEVKNAPADGGCEYQYKKKFRLPYKLNGKVLLHVRAINGQSYNKVEGVY